MQLAELAARAGVQKPPALKVAHRGETEKEGKKNEKKKKSCIKARDRKAVNKSGYPRMSGDEVSH